MRDYFGFQQAGLAFAQRCSAFALIIRLQPCVFWRVSPAALEKRPAEKIHPKYGHAVTLFGALHRRQKPLVKVQTCPMFCGGTLITASAGGFVDCSEGVARPRLILWRPFNFGKNLGHLRCTSFFFFFAF